MSHSAVARLLTAGIAAATVLAPAWAIAPASAVSTSASCADVRLARSTAPDGDYEITVFGKTVSVWCADMATAPTEYLTLPRTGSPFNVSEGVDFSGDTAIKITTHYTRVRLNLPTSAGQNFSINPTDHRFATSDGAIAHPWGYTGSCGNAPHGANLDLTGTPFGMSKADVEPTGAGSGESTISADTQIMTIKFKGDCGTMRAKNPLPMSWLFSVPSVTTDPIDQTVASGGDATFTASGTGTPTPTLTWQSSPDGTTWTDVPGATSGTLTVPGATYALNGTRYRALATSSQGSTPSAPATLSVVAAAPVLTTAPVARSAQAGDDAVFTAAAGGDPAPLFQWQTSVDGAVWTDVLGATTSTLTLADVTTAQDGLHVRVVASSVGGTVTSASVLLTVVAAAPAPAPAATPAGSGPGEPALAVSGASPTAIALLAGALIAAGFGGLLLGRRRVAPRPEQPCST